MADRVAITPGSGDYVLTDQVVHPTFGQGQVQIGKILDATPDSVNGWKIEADGAARFVADAVSAATTSAVASSATAITLVAANTARRALSIFNFSTSDLYIKLGTGAAFSGTPSFLARLGPSSYWEMPTRPIFTGLVSGIWSAVNGYAMITEA